MNLQIASIAIPLVCGWGAATMSASEPPSAVTSASIDEPLLTEGVVNAPIAELWKVFSTAEGFKKLGPAQCDMDFRIGGLIRSHYDAQGKLGDDGTIQNEFLAFETPRMVAFRIQKPPKRFPFSENTWKGTWTVITLTDLGDHRTHLRIAGMGYPDTEEGRKMREFFERGNAWTLAHLQQQFDSAAPRPTTAAHAADPLAPVSLETVVRLPRSEVWNLLSTAAGWKQFMGAGAAIDLRPGGKFEIHFDPKAPEGQRGSEGCTVQSFIPNRMLSYTWNAPPKFAHVRGQRTWVVVQLDELGPVRTRVRIDHLGFADQARENPEDRAEWQDVREYFEQAWRTVLVALANQAP